MWYFKSTTLQCLPSILSILVYSFYSYCIRYPQLVFGLSLFNIVQDRRLGTYKGLNITWVSHLLTVSSNCIGKIHSVYICNYVLNTPDTLLRVLFIQYFNIGSRAWDMESFLFVDGQHNTTMYFEAWDKNADVIFSLKMKWIVLLFIRMKHKSLGII